MSRHPSLDKDIQTEHVELRETGVKDGFELLSQEDADWMRSRDESYRKRVVRKMDVRIVPVFAILYLVSHIDRGNLGNAKIEGLSKSLGLVGNQYNIASSLFFVPYIIFELPSNMVLKRLQPSHWLSILMLAWGIVMTCMGAVQDFSGLVACRWFLGVAEAGFFPGAVYIVSCWYTRSELQQRIALFYTMSALSGAFSGLLAFAIANMNGLRGIEGWRWIFIVEGAITVALSLAMPWLIVDTPEKAKWLTDEEKRFVHLRLVSSGVRSQTNEADKFSWKLLLQTFMDWKIILGILMAWANSVPNAAFTFTMPEIVQGLGFSRAQAQLLTIPPYFCGAVSSYTTARIADRFSWRMPFIVGPMILLATALSLLLALGSFGAKNIPGMYVGVILAQIGIYPLLPGISAWTSNNLAPSWKRSMGLAYLLGAGNIGSLIGSNIFLQNEAPQYKTGYGVALGVVCLGIISALVLEFNLKRLNVKKKQAQQSSDQLSIDPRAHEALGEKSPLWQYTL